MHRKGISEIVSTIIIVSALLMISIAIMFIANNIFAYQSQNAEFEQAKDSYINLAEVIESVAGREGASGYVKLNTLSGGPYFESNAGYIRITVYNGSIIELYSSNYNVFKYRAGNLVGVGGREELRGTRNLTVVNNEFPLGNVYVVQSNGVWIILNYSRIGLINLGVFNFTKGLNEENQTIFEPLNVIELHYIELTPGSFSGSGSLYIVATCKEIKVGYYRIKTVGNNSITFTVENTVGSESYDIAIDGEFNTLIMFVRSVIEINIFGG